MMIESDKKFLERVRKADIERAKRKAQEEAQGRNPGIDWGQRSVDALNAAVREKLEMEKQQEKEKDDGEKQS